MSIEFLQRLALDLSAALFIAWAAYFSHKVYENWTNSKLLDQKLLGYWYSSFQTNEKSPRPSWTLEKINIERKRWYHKIVLETVTSFDQKEYQYAWKSKEARVCDKLYLYGTYSSKLENKSIGVFALLPHKGPSGDVVLGFFLGPNHSKTPNFGAWILVRAEPNSGLGPDEEATAARRGLEAAKAEFRTVAPTFHEIARRNR